MVGSADCVRILDGDQFTHDALPKVQAVLLGLQLGVRDGDEGGIVRNAKDAAIVEARERTGRRGEGVLADDEGFNLVARGSDSDIGGRGELGKVEVVGVRPSITRR